MDLPGLHSSHNNHVAIHTNADQKEDAGIEVGFFNYVDQLAQSVTKDPSSNDGGGEEGQGEGHKYVSDHQVEQVDVRWRKKPQVQEDDQSNNHIARDGKKEDLCK